MHADDVFEVPEDSGFESMARQRLIRILKDAVVADEKNPERLDAHSRAALLDIYIKAEMGGRITRPMYGFALALAQAAFGGRKDRIA
jgi:hypothetical protein